MDISPGRQNADDFTSINGLHYYFEFIPAIALSTGIPIFGGASSIGMAISFPMMGFAYLINQDIAFSVWVFYLLGLLVQTYFAVLGVTRGVTLDIYGQVDGGPIMAFVQFGALVALVANTLWIARRRLASHLARAFGHRLAGADEDAASRAVVVQLGLGLALMTGWLIATGIPWWASLTLVLAAVGTFLGITRILCETGVAATRAQLISGTVVKSLFGTAALGGRGTVGALALSQVWMSDVRTFVMAAVANGFKLTETVRRQGVVLTGMVLAVILAVVVSVWATIYLAYQVGANNASGWFFLAGPRYTVNFAAHFINNPVGPDVEGMGLMAVGASIMGALYWLRTHFPGFPLHPIGLAISQINLTRSMWFSVFLVWLFKAIIIRYGGPRLLAAARPFFLGLILGRFTVAAVWHLVDYLTGATGHHLYGI